MDPITMQQYGQEKMARAREQADLMREIQRAKVQADRGHDSRPWRLAIFRDRLSWHLGRVSTMFIRSFSVNDN